MEDNEDLLSGLLNPSKDHDEHSAEAPAEASAPEPLGSLDLNQPLEPSTDPGSSDFAHLETAEAPANQEPSENTTQLTQDLSQEIAASEAQVTNFSHSANEASLPEARENENGNFSLIISGGQSAVNGGDASNQEKLDKLLADFGLKTNASTTKVFSKLDEYRAIYLSMEASKLGYFVDVSPTAFPSTEWDPSGEEKFDLIQDQVGAPKVTLARSAKEVLLTTGDSLPGKLIQLTHGLVSCHVAIPRRFFREDEAQKNLEQDLQKLGDPKVMPESHYETLLKELSLRIQLEALSKSANAVVGLELEFFPEIQAMDRSNDEMRILLSGTAVSLA